MTNIKPMPDELFLSWKKDKSPQSMAKIVKKFTPLLRSELPKYYGNLPIGHLAAYGKKFIIDAIKTYNPEKGKMTTHLVSNLRRLHRVNYDTSSSVRMSEELQRSVNIYKGAKEHLSDKFNREPSFGEIADKLKWPVNKIARMEKCLKQEVLSSSMQVAPKIYEQEDPRLDYIYHDLGEVDKVIFQHRIGYKGAELMNSKKISKLVKLSIPAISIRSKKIAETIKNKFRISGNANVGL
jgi:DNA-directed RNA polymerase specialized sigma subunit